MNLHASTDRISPHDVYSQHTQHTFQEYMREALQKVITVETSSITPTCHIIYLRVNLSKTECVMRGVITDWHCSQ